MATKIRTEYAVQSTALRHGKWQTVIEPIAAEHATDREWGEVLVADRRIIQVDAGCTPDAVLVARTVTTSDWYGI